MLSHPNPENALSLFQQLCSIPGGSGDEQQVAQFVIQQLKAAGVQENQIAFDQAYLSCPIPESKTGNLFVDLPGATDDPRIVLMAHLDTVPVCIGAIPKLSGDTIVPQDRSTGLGADNRAGVAVVLSTALELLRSNSPHPPITLLFTVQEEIGVQGARHLDTGRLNGASMAFNWDGGNPVKLTTRAIGGYRMTIEITGKASHAGLAPEKGISAITVAGLAIQSLHDQGLLGKIDQAGKQGTSNLGIIRGGTATNVVADRVTLTAEVRSHQLATIDWLAHQFDEAFQHASKSVTSDLGEPASVQVRGDLNYEPFQMPADAECIGIAEQAIRDCGFEPEQAIANGGLDANWMNRHGIPTVSLGCGQKNPHMTSELLEIPKFRQACEIAWKIVTKVD